jgi:hypothetical protein
MKENKKMVNETIKIDFSQMPKGNDSFTLDDVSNGTDPAFVWMEEQLKLVDINEYVRQLNEYYISKL